MSTEALNKEPSCSLKNYVQYNLIDEQAESSEQLEQLLHVRYFSLSAVIDYYLIDEQGGIL